MKIRIGRRDFLRRTAKLGTAFFLGLQGVPADVEIERPLSPQPLDPSGLARFVDPLAIPEVARTQIYRSPPKNPERRAPYYRIEMREFFSKVHRDLPPTRMWGYGGTWPGPTIEVRSHEDILIEWVNLLPEHHLFAIDTHLHGAESDKPDVRTVVHVHGARVAPEDDGYPESWFTSGQSAVFHYPNIQNAATLWYHDHTIGITRLNIFAGLMGVFIIRDDNERALHFPEGRYDIPLVICDRSFDSRGQLDYPIGPRFREPWVPEFRGNAIVINGRLFPYLEVEPRRYRFRIINTSNGRALSLSLSGKAPLMQIASDQGLLTTPAEMRNLFLSPAERADVLVDFAPFSGSQLTLLNEDVEVMQFRVSSKKVPDPSSLPSNLGTVEKLLPSRAIRTRILTLDEYMDPLGRVVRSLLNGTRWGAPVTETPTLGTTEIWCFVNLTKDAHPIHLHGVRLQLLDRRPFDVSDYQRDRVLKYTGPALSKQANESGWKDTVRADPGTVTRIIVPFEKFPGRFSWHCHILEHEDNEMMRPLEIRPHP